MDELLNKTKKTTIKGKRALDIYNDYYKMQKEAFSKNHKSAPFNIKEFIKEFGLNLDYQTVYDYSGKIKGNTITVNSLDKEYRQRFTIAHELAHYLLHLKDNDEEKVDLYRGHDYPTDTMIQEEKEANDFAAELLMPEDLCDKLYNDLIKKFDEPDDFMHIMAEAFNVSKQAIIIRLKNTGIIPKDKWVWYK